ncbi:MAG: 3-deoxy-manno-octulosonate cytidylyltransferase [Saprospiraceae bacterium]|nr:3-deoxy-manno-octulosonate cytidylyltransferase [Saprospiraceae bacterium]
MKVLGIIPARYGSTRFEGKPLVNIQGKSMIRRVYEQAKKAESLAHVIVATDDERIFDHVKSFGGDVMMTAQEHQSGTDRCAEVATMMNLDVISTNFERAKTYAFDSRRTLTFDAVVNIQGDEPFINPLQIDKVVDILRGGIFPLATLAKKIDNQEDIQNPNIVKVVFAADGRALYFSRSPIPNLRNTPQYEWAGKGEIFKHIGIYGYRNQTLQEIARLPQSRLEKLESLEQLRWLENGYSIGVSITDLETIGIDTPEDLLKI